MRWVSDDLTSNGRVRGAFRVKGAVRWDENAKAKPNKFTNSHGTKLARHQTRGPLNCQHLHSFGELITGAQSVRRQGFNIFAKDYANCAEMDQSQPAQSQSSSSRRAYPRQAIDLRALVYPENGRSWFGTIKDFCPGGMFLLSEGTSSLEASGSIPRRGDEVDIHLTVPMADGDRRFRLHALVARVTADGNGLGVFYPEGMDQLVLEALGEYALATGKAPVENEAVQQAPVASPEFKFNPLDAKRVLEKLNTIIATALPHLSKTFFDDADKDLLEQAGYASDSHQGRYFEALAELDGRRDELTTVFLGSIEEQENPLDVTVSEKKSAPVSLSLVNIGQFESWLALAEIISKLEMRFERELDEMHTRLALIAVQWRDITNLPVGPAVVSRAFEEALSRVQLDQEIKLLLYLTFQHVMESQLKNLYDAINQMLVDSKVFPSLDELQAQQRLSPAVVREDSVGSADGGPALSLPTVGDVNTARSPSPAEARDSLNPPEASIKPFAPEQQANAASSNLERRAAPTRGVFEAATTLLNLQNQLHCRPGNTNTSPDAYSPSEVADGLRELQQERGGTPIETAEIRDRLLALLRWSSDGAQDKRIGDAENEAMSVVGSFVNSICQDNFLSEGVKEWVKRLELTLNKLAMQDSRFFEDQSNQPHAAMQVLNQLAVFGRGLDEDENINRELGGDEIDSLVERVIEEFDNNPEIFGEVLKDLNPIVDRQTRSYQGNLQRTVRACEGRQRLSSARMDVVGEVEKRLAGREVPTLILDLLNPGWRNLLVRHHLRHGRDSESWNQCLDVLEQLVGQLSGRIQPDDPKYVQAPELLSAVESGLSSISFDPVGRAPLLHRLSKALEGDSEKEMVLLDPNDSAKAVGLEDAVPETEPLSEQADPADQRTWCRWLNQARTLKVGDWLEVSDNSAARVNLSLAWIGKQHVSFVLVDRKGIKAREITLREMVQSLMDGSIHPLDESNVPLMERASHRMLETLHNQLAHQASHDGLTGLVNRKEFENRLEKAIITAQNKGQHHVVLYTDLDQFKIINNVAGHTAGDELLKILAAVLRDELRGVRGTLARLGGDEFGTLLEEVTTETGIEIAHRQIDAIRNCRFDWQEHHFSLSACVGVVNVDQSVADVNEVMRNADAACYAAKEAGRNRVLMFEPDDDMAHRRGVMEQVGRIDRVLAEDRLLLNYQRIIPISADAPVAFEFLLRVLDEDGNVLPPAALINAAESYNKMTLIDRWVVCNALQWMATLGEELDEIGHFSINLSGNSLNDDDFADYVLDQLTSGSVPTNKICFEITETATIANRSHAVAFMDKMKVIGCQFALDDFGTGLSSYSYLRSMPVDYLKIDHIFVKDLDRSPGDYAVVKSINEIGHVMGKKTIAEGVENDDILKLLREIGVDYGQGYGIEKPRPITEFKL